MICPKCGFEQPEGPECLRCGIIVSRYRGPAAGARVTPPAFSPAAPAPPPSFIPPPPVIAGGTVQAPLPPPPQIVGGSVYGAPAAAAPAMPADPSGGTVYGGPPPGTVYGGQGSVAPAFSSFSGGRPFHGTFETGKILGEAFSVYFSNFIPFTLLSVLALSPLLLYSAWVSSLPQAHPLVPFAGLLGSLIQLFCVPIATAAITYGVYQQLRGGDTSLGACLQVGLSTLFPMLGLAFVQGFAVGLGTLACLVPGILLAVRWAVSIPSKVEEKLSVGDALNRSTFLTEGFRWQVFGVLAVFAVIGFVLQFGVGVALGVSAVRSGKPLHTGTVQLATSLVTLATTSITATASAVMYYRLRSVKESIDVDQISSVFV
ncbi:MAG TPA: hypothetical protein VF173_29175 [Thermoanaerobaculia bacterium]|nr:hypothetical protein [Thermoanaerobaculia bacterium]